MTQRCEITNNLCGTDTWPLEYECQCKPCQKMLREVKRNRVRAAYLKELSWIEDEKQRLAWLKEWLRIYEIGMIAAVGEEQK